MKDAPLSLSLSLSLSLIFISASIYIPLADSPRALNVVAAARSMTEKHHAAQKMHQQFPIYGHAYNKVNGYFIQCYTRAPKVVVPKV